MNYLSEQKDIQKLPRLYLSNIIYSIMVGEFKKWQDHIVHKRN